MTEQKQDVDKMKKLASLLDKSVKIGEKVFDDGKLTTSDVIYAPEIIGLLTDLFTLVKDHGPELLEELKDIDFSEVKEVIGEVE